MSQSVVDLLDEQNVVASLQPGPEGKLRLSYEYPQLSVTGGVLGPAMNFGSLNVTYVSPVIEIDRVKLRKLQFTQQELAEIGFSLVARLSALAHDPALDGDA